MNQPGWRRPRLVGVIVLGLVALVLLFVIASLSLDEGDDEPIEIEGASAVQRLLGGIPQDGARLGDPDAAVTAQVFSDLQCEPCADYHSDVISPLIAGPVRSGDLALEFHHFSMSDRETVIASFGAVAAAKQDYEWQFIQLFFVNQDEAKDRGVTEEFLDRIAGAILNFNVEQWQRDFDNAEAPDVKETVEADGLLAANRKLPAEPAVVVDGPLGTRELVESPSRQEIDEAIAAVQP